MSSRGPAQVYGMFSHWLKASRGSEGPGGVKGSATAGHQSATLPVAGSLQAGAEQHSTRLLQSTPCAWLNSFSKQMWGITVLVGISSQGET